MNVHPYNIDKIPLETPAVLYIEHEANWAIVHHKLKIWGRLIIGQHLICFSYKNASHAVNTTAGKAVWVFVSGGL